MFWSKLYKSNWKCAWNLAFTVFISLIVRNMCENLHYESVNLQRATQRARILLTDNILNGDSCSVNYYWWYWDWRFKKFHPLTRTSCQISNPFSWNPGNHLPQRRHRYSIWTFLSLLLLFLSNLVLVFLGLFICGRKQHQLPNIQPTEETTLIVFPIFVW